MCVTVVLLRVSLLQVWQSLFSVRSLVVPMHEDVDAWLKFAGLCRKNGRQRQVRSMASFVCRLMILTLFSSFFAASGCNTTERLGCSLRLKLHRALNHIRSWL